MEELLFESGCWAAIPAKIFQRALRVNPGNRSCPDVVILYTLTPSRLQAQLLPRKASMVNSFHSISFAQSFGKLQVFSGLQFFPARRWIHWLQDPVTTADLLFLQGKGVFYPLHKFGDVI